WNYLLCHRERARTGQGGAMAYAHALAFERRNAMDARFLRRPILLIACIAGCLEPKLPACSFLCESGGRCPLDLTCGQDGYCHSASHVDPCVAASVDGGADSEIGVAPGGPYNFMFVTSQNYTPGTLGTHGMSGLDYADAECNRLAQAATPPIQGQRFL